mgnify:CR=1 FL=1
MYMDHSKLVPLVSFNDERELYTWHDIHLNFYETESYPDFRKQGIAESPIRKQKFNYL